MIHKWACKLINCDMKQTRKAKNCFTSFWHSWDFMVQITDVYYIHTLTMLVCVEVFVLSSRLQGEKFCFSLAFCWWNRIKTTSPLQNSEPQLLSCSGASLYSCLVTDLFWSPMSPLRPSFVCLCVCKCGSTAFVRSGQSTAMPLISLRGWDSHMDIMYDGVMHP